MPSACLNSSFSKAKELAYFRIPQSDLAEKRLGEMRRQSDFAGKKHREICVVGRGLRRCQAARSRQEPRSVADFGGRRIPIRDYVVCTVSNDRVLCRNTLAAPIISSFYSTSPPSIAFFFKRTRWSNRRRSIRSMAPDLLGDFGARDPFPAELESNFGEKVVGNESTEHRILIPNLSVISLAQRSCQPVSSFQHPLSKEDAEKLLKKVVGWRLVESDEGMKIQCTWRVRDYGCGIELITRIYGALEVSGHYPNLHLEQPNQIRAELQTTTIGGLSLNDFIVAAKIDQVKTVDLVPKKRVWA